MTGRTLCLTSALALAAGGAAAQEMSFNRIASFATPQNMAEGEDRGRATSAEIVDATADGMTLVYTDSPLGVLGRIDIRDPENPLPLGNVGLDGEPTSVTVIGGNAFVGVNTSESYTDPSGHLAVIDIASGEERARCDLGGQPDSIARTPDGDFLAVAIENERDEDAGDGRVGQMPAGYLVLLDVADPLDCAAMTRVDLTGLAEIAPEDPEPEFVDINADGEIVVTLQENNHVVVVSPAGEVVSHFPAGSVDLEGIDETEEGALTFTATQRGVVREPDSVQWLDADHIVTANEGDMDGGTRGWTVFRQDGTVVWDSGLGFERALVEIGHYPEGRSGNKGVEPEAVEVATFGGTPMAFIGSERGNIVGVYDMSDPANPVLSQLLPSGIGPEGLVALPDRDLLVTANEEDLGEDGGPRAHVMIYRYGEGAPAYPQITSAGSDELIGWGALSGLAAGEAPGQLYAINDSFYAMQPTIFTIDATQTPARITAALRVTRNGQPAQKLDMEGIATDGEGGFWIASEGRVDRVLPAALYHLGADGAIEEEIGLPPELNAVVRRHGFEGVTMVDGMLWIAVQREWMDDPEGRVKLVSYDPESEAWGAVAYPLEPAGEGWVGLSEIAAHGDWIYVIERDNQIGDRARMKKIFRVARDQLRPAPLGSELPLVEKEEVYDLMRDLEAPRGYVQEKVEGLAIDAAGTAWVVTDNDGVDDSSGETLFFSIGKL